MQATVSSRHGLNPDHNIWNNNGTWWCHFTVHHPDHTKERVRVSLGTKDREEARRQRDFIMRGTTAIAARLPHRRAQAMPDLPHASENPSPSKACKIPGRGDDPQKFRSRLLHRQFARSIRNELPWGGLPTAEGQLE
jgi:hypothetical protein